MNDCLSSLTDKEKKIVKSGLFAAGWLAGSPHEWQWSQKEQEAMAHSVIILHDELLKLQKKYDQVSPPYTRERCGHRPKYCRSKLCKRCYDRLAQQHRRTHPAAA